MWSNSSSRLQGRAQWTWLFGQEPVVFRNHLGLRHERVQNIHQGQIWIPNYFFWVPCQSIHSWTCTCKSKVSGINTAFHRGPTQVLCYLCFEIIFRDVLNQSHIGWLAQFLIKGTVNPKLWVLLSQAKAHRRIWLARKPWPVENSDRVWDQILYKV